MSASGMPLSVFAVVPGLFLFVIPSSHGLVMPHLARQPLSRSPCAPQASGKKSVFGVNFFDPIFLGSSASDALQYDGITIPWSPKPTSGEISRDWCPSLVPTPPQMPPMMTMSDELSRQNFEFSDSSQVAGAASWGEAEVIGAKGGVDWPCQAAPRVGFYEDSEGEDYDGEFARLNFDVTNHPQIVTRGSCGESALDGTEGGRAWPPQAAFELVFNDTDDGESNEGATVGRYGFASVNLVHAALELDRLTGMLEQMPVFSLATGRLITAPFGYGKRNSNETWGLSVAAAILRTTFIPVLCVMQCCVLVMSLASTVALCLLWCTSEICLPVAVELLCILALRPLRFAVRNPSFTVLLLLGSWIVGAEAVTCFACHDACPGCTGGPSCPYYTLPFINQGILGSATGTHDETIPGTNGGAARTVTHSVLAATLVLPRVIARFMTRGVLDFFKTVARRPRTGATPDVDSMTEAELVAAVRGGSVTPDDAMASVLTRISTATQAGAPRLNALASTIGHMTKLGSTSTTVGTGANGELLGAFTFAWTLTGRVVQHAGASVAVAGEALGSDTTEGRAILQAKILRPRSQTELSHMLLVWGMICHAMGLAHTLATGTFALKVVYDQMSMFGLTWEQAHELFLVYLEAVETATAECNLTLANVYESGGQDMYREKAITRAKEHFKVKPPQPRPDGGGDGGERIFRGQSTPTSSKCCLTFNLGRDKHPQAALDKHGKCLFAHKCDAWVTEQPDGTKGGICGSTKHGRHQCTNPKRSDTKVTG